MSPIIRVSSTPHLGLSSRQYKSQEDQYDEIRLLKLQLANVTEEGRQHRALLVRCRHQLDVKHKQLDEFLNDAAAHSTPGSSAAVLTQLQRRVCRLEKALCDRDEELRKLRSDTRIVRLQEVKQQALVYRGQLAKLRGQRTGNSESDLDEILRRARRDNLRMRVLLGDEDALSSRIRVKYAGRSRVEMIQMTENLCSQLRQLHSYRRCADKQNSQFLVRRRIGSQSTCTAAKIGLFSSGFQQQCRS